MNARTLIRLIRAAICAAGLAGIFPATTVRAEDMPVFAIEFNDGVVSPLRLEVPANKPFKIVLHNKGKTPAEFESTNLHQEKVLAAESTSFIVFRRLAPGEYSFFDDFHPNAPQAVVIAK
ncbi:MAG: cupredoxin domain-containing protein [Proteobacteria bacterium]|nr:cupredoxin domain-containing protein [Pseudomonadota bacterium]